MKLFDRNTVHHEILMDRQETATLFLTATKLKKLECASVEGNNGRGLRHYLQQTKSPDWSRKS